MLRYIFLFIIPFIGYAQSPNESKLDSLELERIDTLRSYIRNEFFKRNYDKTIEYGELARELSKKREYYHNYYKVSSFLGNAYLEIDDSLHAKSIFQEAIEIARIEKDTAGILASEIDFANFYALQEKNTSKLKAIALYKKIIPLAKKAKSDDRLQVLNSNISELLLDLKKTDLAAFYVKESEKYVNDSLFIGFIGSTNLNKGRLLTQTGRYSDAEKNLAKSLEIFKSIDYLEGVIDVYYTLIENAIGREQYKQAYQFQKELDMLELEKYEVDKLEAIQTVTARFKLKEVKKQLEDEKLLNEIRAEKTKQEITFFWVKIATGILLLFSIIAFFSYLKRKKLVASLLNKNKQYIEEKERSEELSKAKSLLFSNITHELRTPMYGIIGISNILLQESESSYNSKHLKSLRFSADYLLSLVNNILQFNRYQNNEVVDKIVEEKIEIRNLVYNIIESSKYLSEQHPNTHNVLIDNNIPNIILGDRTKLSQILINLIGNASKFTNDGTIDVKLDLIENGAQNVTIEFSIIDNGPGIAAKNQEHIFDRLKQSSQNQDFMGTGLGLPIVKKMLEDQQSELCIDSELGKGTTITFSLNFNIENITLADKATQSMEEGNSIKKSTILVVDDNKINLLVTKNFLERHGANAIVLESGKEAIDAIKKSEFDLVLMDINMPEMNGFKTTEVIRGFNKEIPIIALTAVEKEKVVGDHSFHLMNGIIIKPYSNEKFLSTIHTHLKSPAI